MLKDIAETVTLRPFWRYWNLADHGQNLLSLTFSGCKVAADIAQSVFMSSLAEAVSTNNNSVNYTIFGKTWGFDQVGLVWGYGVSYAVSSLCQYLSEITLTGVTEKTGRDFCSALVTKINTFRGEDSSLVKYEGHNVLTYANQFYSDVASTHTFIIREFFPNLMTTFGVFFAMGNRVDWLTSLTYGGLMTGYVLVNITFDHCVISMPSKIIQKKYELEMNHFNGFYERKPMIESFQSEESEARERERGFKELMDDLTCNEAIKNTYRWGKSFIPTGMVLLIFLKLLKEARKSGDEIKPNDIDDFIFFSQIIPLAIRGVEQLIKSIQVVNQKATKLSSVFGFFSLTYPRYPTTGAGHQVDQTIEMIYSLNDLSFGYLRKRTDAEKAHANSTQLFVRADHLQLSNITFRVRRGQRIAIVGESGCGKSTLIRLLNRDMELFRPAAKFGPEPAIANTFLFYNLNMHEVAIDAVKSLITMETRDPYIDSTKNLKGNITYGLPDLTPDQTNRYNRLVQEFELTGLDQQEKLNNPSGGQRQRIGLIRALMRGSPIIFLDEPTSALDSILEAKVMARFFAELQPTQTVIIVAHRLSTIKNCSNIYVMEKGRIVQAAETNPAQSAHDQLLTVDYPYPRRQDGGIARHPSLYKKYWDIQSGLQAPTEAFFTETAALKTTVFTLAGGTAEELAEYQEDETEDNSYFSESVSEEEYSYTP